jgi:glyceraldehyde-3-phosphate dehydrogenase (NAD(P))
LGNTNTVLVVGTGTIGEPLTGLLSDKNISKDLGIDELIFYKHSPRLTDRPMMKGLLSKGAQMATQREKFEAFRELGIEPTYTFEEALAKSKVIADCSSEGMGVRNKLLFYEKMQDSASAFLAQGSEHGFGLPYGVGLNDDVLKRKKNKFIQVVSCNTHNASRVLKNLAFDKNGKNKLSEGRFVFMRRATDVSQSGKFIASPSVGPHKDSTFGTHHAKDVYRLYSTLGYHLNVFSSAIKLNTQYMHVASFHLVLDNHDCDCDLEDVERKFRDDPYVAVTNKTDANVIFSFGREYGHFGRILNQTVIVLPSLLVRKSNLFTDKVEVVGYSYTPQDGNSLLSSTSAVAYFLNPEEVILGEPLPCLRPFIFTEV